MEVTAYIRPPEGKETPATIVESSFATILELQKRGMYSEVKLVQGGDQPALPGWARTSFTGKADGQPFTSFVYGSIKGPWVIKLRITSQDPKSDAPGKFFAEFRKLIDAAPAK